MRQIQILSGLCSISRELRFSLINSSNDGESGQKNSQNIKCVEYFDSEQQHYLVGNQGLQPASNGRLLGKLWAKLERKRPVPPLLFARSFGFTRRSYVAHSTLSPSLRPRQHPLGKSHSSVRHAKHRYRYSVAWECFKKACTYSCRLSAPGAPVWRRLGSLFSPPASSRTLALAHVPG